jgi:flagella basal body P-ring formation protein FlgA
MITLFIIAAVTFSWSPEVVIRDYLKYNYPWPEIEVKPVINNLELPKVPPKKIFILKGLPGRTTFLLRFPTGESIEYEAMVKAFDWVIKSRRSIGRGEVIGKEDIYKALQSIKHMPKGSVIKEDIVVGKVLKRSIPANYTITEENIENIHAIKKGQKVILLFDNGHLRITAKGVAKEDGFIGENIKVLNTSSKKQIEGKIIDNQTIMVNK